MIRQIILINYIFCSLLLISQNEKTISKFKIYTSPSQILMGDIPIGVEHHLYKRLSHELFLQVKCFNSLFPFYKFNRGIGGKYFFNYSFFNLNKVVFKANFGYGYRYFYYNNKLDIPPVAENDIVLNNNISSMPNEYLMSKKINTNTLIIGLSSEVKVFKKMQFGVNLFFEYGIKKNWLQVNDPEFALNYNINSPYILSNTKNYNNIHLIFKLGYAIY